MSEMTLDDFRKKVSDTKVECRICHFKSYSIVSHLQETHHLSVGAYKNRYPKGEVVSVLVTAIMKQRPRQKMVKTQVLNTVWDSMSDWDFKELEKFGASMPHSHQEWVLARDDAFFFQKRPTSVVGLAVAEGMNLFISGPTECGKTALVEQVHAFMGRPILRCNMTGDTTVKNFVGQMQLNDKGTFFQDGILKKAMEGGCTLLIDEIDFMPPHIGAVLHPVLEKGRSLFVPELAKTVKAEPGFTVVATANTGGKGDSAGIYTGTEVLNTAFLDRFQMRMEMEYLPPEVEIEVLRAKFPNQDERFLERLVHFAGEVRIAFKQGSLEITLGTRKLEDFVRISEKMGGPEAYRLVLTDWLSPEERQLLDEIKNRCMP